MTSRSLASLLAFALTPLALGAQTALDTAHIAPVVVTGTRSPLSIERSPASVSVISGEELRREGITTVIDALRQVPGLAVVQTGSYGGATSVFIRGGESKFAKVLVDGVAVNDAGGSFDFSGLTTDNLDRIEIVRGPASVLYGSDAMAGVVQLFTRGGAGPTHVDASGRGGGFGTYDADAAVRGSGEHLSYSVAGARHSTNGIQLFNSQFRQSVASARVGLNGLVGDAQLTMRYNDGTVHYPTDGSGQVVDSMAVHRDDRLSVGLDAGHRLTSQSELRLSLSSYDVHGITDDQPDSRGDIGGYYYTTGDRSYRRSADLRLNVDLPSSGRATVGAMVEREWQTSSTQSNFGPSQFSARRRNTGSYAQLLLAPTVQSTVVRGGRFEHNEKFGDFFTYRAAASDEVLPGTRLRASLGTAFREPTMLENFGGAFAIGNPNLTPEHALSYDAGVEQQIAAWGSVGATYFNNSFRDLIDYKYSATAPNYSNIARTRSSGVELEGRASSATGFQADAAFTYLDTRVVDPGTSSAATAAFAPGSHLLRRPMHTLDAGVGYHVARGGVDVRSHSVGTREDVYYAPDFSAKRVTLDPYTRIDLSGELIALADAQHTVTATARIENLFDRHYTDVAGINYAFTQTDDASIAHTGYRAAGRRALVGLRLVL